MEGKPLIPGSEPEAQPNLAEAVPTVASPETPRVTEALPIIQPRTSETAPPPTSIATTTPETSPTNQPPSSPSAPLAFPSRDEVFTMDLAGLNELQNAMFERQAEK